MCSPCGCHCHTRTTAQATTARGLLCDTSCVPVTSKILERNIENRIKSQPSFSITEKHAIIVTSIDFYKNSRLSIYLYFEIINEFTLISKNRVASTSNVLLCSPRPLQLIIRCNCFMYLRCNCLCIYTQPKASRCKLTPVF